jgi:hypothetical protein
MIGKISVKVMKIFQMPYAHSSRKVRKGKAQSAPSQSM